MLVGVADGGYTQQTVITYVCLQQNRRVAKAIGAWEGKGTPCSRVWLMRVEV